MNASRRTLIAGAGATAAALAPSADSLAQGAAGNAQAAVTPGDLAALVRRSHDANAALLRGDVDAYLELIKLTNDFSFMGPFGGPPGLAAAYTDERMRSIGAFFKNGVLETELVEAYTAPDLAVLAVIERAEVEVGGLPRQPWTLRVTLVYRRESGEWRLAHRHADPLGPGISVPEAAALTARTPQP